MLYWKCPYENMSRYELWLMAVMNPPSTGMCSVPRQSRLNRSNSGGFAMTAARRYQKPILRRDTRTPSSYDRAIAWLLGVKCRPRPLVCREHGTPRPRPLPSGPSPIRATMGPMRMDQEFNTDTEPVPLPALVWSLVVPLKPLALAKSRLAGAADDRLRPRLALAFAQDTVAAALACPAVRDVAVVTDDPAAAAGLTALGARIVPDSPAAGLNAAL
ncbi:predicted protein, partial [Streptomyces pristinaespiralis ATCC 25486]